MEISSGVAALIGSAIGALASILTTRINVKGNTKAQLELELLKKDYELKEMQRNVLINLHDLINEVVEISIKIINENSISLKKNKEFVKFDFYNPKGLSKEFVSVGARFYNLVHRIQNDDLRKKLIDFDKKLTKIVMAKNYEELNINFKKIKPVEIQSLNEQIGEEIRKTY